MSPPQSRRRTGAGAQRRTIFNLGDGVHSDRYREGIALFNAGEFFAAHEALEDVWREAHGDAKTFLQAIIQVAVALHHHSTGNLAGARSLLGRGARKLAPFPSQYGGLRVSALRDALEHWERALSGHRTPPPPPRLEAVAGDAKLAPPVNRAASRKKAVPTAVKDGVPLLDLRRQYEPIRREVLAAIARVCDSQQFVLGEEVEAFEREAAQFLGAAHAVGCASGTDALWLALLASGVKPGDEVITTPFSFYASASAIVRAGARPVFVDIDPRTLNLSAAEVERRLVHSRPSRVSAILPVHLYGQCADMDAFSRLGHEHHLAVVEDAAQAFGAAWGGRRAGTLGVAAAFSFYPSKNLSAFGDAGCVTTADAAAAERMRVLRNHGAPRRYYHEELGANSRLDAIQAAVLRVKMEHVEEWNSARRERAATYTDLLRESGLGHAGSPVQVVETAPEASHIFHQYVIRAARRAELREFLRTRHIGTEIYYPLPLHLQRAFAYLGYGVGDFPQAERAAEEVLALPIFPELTAEEQRTVVSAIAEFYS